ncbi:MAG: hypothetical protein IKJ24_07570 [Clostridia bacterium]|nr:hypothetical protein [Clostridia bacterium]
MYNNVGSKVKTFASISCIIGIIASIITGVTTIIAGNVLGGFLTCAIGAFASWIASLALYAIGHTAENTDMILKRLKNIDTNQTNSSINENIEIPKYAQTQRPQAKTSETTSGSWWCSCGVANRNSSNTCSSCYKSRPTQK